jgi:sugar transferase (PEP-CTERM/EpsH1 system associated)
MSKDLEQWLRTRVGVPAARIRQLYSGVDCGRFRPREHPRADWPEVDLRAPGLLVVGAVGRMESVKDPLNLIRAFIALHQQASEPVRARLRLVYFGDGPLLAEARSLLGEAGLGDKAWLPGSRDDVAELMPGFDAFVLPSLGEGISNTILEAMACGLPVVATEVGGNPELVTADTGILVPSADPYALSSALARYVQAPGLMAEHGRNGRQRVEREFALTVMVDRYHSLYEKFLQERGSIAV